MNTAAVIEQAESTIAVAKLTEAMKPAEYVDVRHPADDVSRITARREVVFTFANEGQAKQFFEAAQKAAGKLA